MGGSSSKNKIYKPQMPEAAAVPVAPKVAPIPSVPKSVPELPTIPVSDTIAAARSRIGMIKRLYTNAVKKPASAESSNSDDLLSKLLE